MDLIQLLFLLVDKFVPIPPADFDSMYNEAIQWRAAEREKYNKGEATGFSAIYFKYMRFWFVRLGVAVAYIPLVRWVMDFMNPSEEGGDRDIKFDKS